MSVATRALFTGHASVPNVPTSAGSIATITDDSKYNAWPVICRLPNGDLLVGYTKADTHHADNTGKGVVKRSTDDGATWGSEVTVYDDPSLWVSLFGLGVTRSGRIIATLWRDDGTSSDDEGAAGVSYSDDNGATWSTWIDVASSFTGGEYGTGPVIICGNGDLLYNVEGRMAAEDPLNRYSKVVRSTDNGLTWGSEVTVRTYVQDTRPYYESKSVRLRDGTIRILHRTAAFSPGTHYISTSIDDGLTWGVPAAIFPGFGAPSVCRLRNDALVAVTRKNVTSAAIAYTSIDGGLNWSSEILIATPAGQMEYGAPIEKHDGTVLVVYGDSPNPLGTDANIKSAILS